MVPDTSQKNFFVRPVQKVIKKMVVTKSIPGQHYPGLDHTHGLRKTEGIFSHRKVPWDIRSPAGHQAILPQTGLSHTLQDTMSLGHAH